jgi:glutamate synthase domain-containing protein 3
VWIGHQRYPTRGRVWHPGGAHPFSGLDEALVHNGDFANYFGVVEYLRQRNYFPLFMTDTEVAVYLFDLYSRVYGYPLEYVIEALAPTTERDFVKLPIDKQTVYRAIQRSHLHASPDGPWFFILARNDVKTQTMQLIGITDTSMLRPQVFALQDGEKSIGVIASEKQAIDALLSDMAKDDPSICPIADKYWNARGGSYSDGGAFIFSVKDGAMVCTDKFGHEVRVSKDEDTLRGMKHEMHITRSTMQRISAEPLPNIADWSFAEVEAFIHEQVTLAKKDVNERWRVIELLTALHDRRYDTGAKKRSQIVARLTYGLEEIFCSITPIGREDAASSDRLIGRDDRAALAPPLPGGGGREGVLFVDCTGFEPQGDDSAARMIVKAYELGWKKFVVFSCRGDRFIGCGLGAQSDGVRIDVYGSSGDYLGSGLDGAEIHVHGDAQDQVGQIMKSGKLVIHGMVGQTFLYGAKGGVAYVLGNAAGRPLINAVGSIRTIINGTALDYAAESFMAGATTGGGFLIINGITFDGGDHLVPLPDRYPGGNFFSLASGGAGYINDPDRTLSDDQLNGGAIVEFAQADWQVIEPYLCENEELFGLQVGDLLNGRAPRDVYRKVIPAGSARKLDAHT